MDAWWKDHITSPVINVLGRRKEQKCFSKPPILIGGCGRSGTTLLLAILSAHPHIYAFSHEVDAFTSWRRIRGQLMPKRVDRLYRFLLTHPVPTCMDRWCEKRPANVHFIAEIMEYFGEDVRFIHIIRDPRAVCTSFHPKKPNEYWISPERWVRDVSAGLDYRGHSRVHTLNYEDLILDSGGEIQKLCTFLDEPVNDLVLNWYDHATVRQNRAWRDGLKELDANSLEKWKKDDHRDRISALMEHSRLVEMMHDLGYS